MPSDEEIKDLLKKAKKGSESKVDQPVERIVDKSIKKVDKAKTEPKPRVPTKKIKTPDKIDLVLSKLENFENRINRIEDSLTNKDTQEQKRQIPQRQDAATPELTPEEKLSKAQAEQEEVQGKQGQPGQQPGSPQGQLTQEEYQKLPDKEKVKLLEGQLQQGQQGQQGNPQNLWILGKLLDNLPPVVIAALQNKGNSGTPLSQFFSQLKVYQGIESTILGGFFNFMKMLPSREREGVISGVIRSPRTPTMVDLPSKSEIIK